MVQRKAKSSKVLLINTQFVELYISGFTNRFIGLWCYLQKKNKDDGAATVHWLTNRSLWNKYFNGVKPPENVTVISARLSSFKFTSRLFYPLYVIFLYYSKRCTSIHVATSVINPIYLVRLFNFFRIPYCFTFASNSIEMGAYNSDAMRRRWNNLFRLAKNVDILNPTNSVDTFNNRKFVSPTSFPYLPEINDIPDAKFINTDRKDTIVFCGSFVDQKNPVLAIEGFYSFLKNSPVARDRDLRLIMVGRGELLNVMREKMANINEEFKKEVIVHKNAADLIEILAGSKVFLSLQDYDNYPSQSVMEAMLFCNSVISINNGDTSKLVDPGKNNVLLEEKDPALLGKAIEASLTGWNLNKANREHILTRFSVATFADYFLDLHAKISSR